MKKLLAIYVFISAIILFSISSCKKDFLDVPNTTRVVREEYINDLKTLEDFMNGIYVQLGANFLCGYGLIYPELVADNLKPVSQGSSIFALHYAWKQQNDEKKSMSLIGSEANMNPFWFAGYRVVRDCSFVIENIDKYRNENTGKADIIKGQAYALRALAHFLMTNVFAQSYNF